MSTKKRLALLPEVLPAPQRTGGQTSSVRSRAVARLKVLAALSAVGVAAACGGDIDSGDGTSGGGVDGGVPGDGGGRKGEDAYGVVDPLPPPACFRRYSPPTATARYAEDDDAGTLDAGTGTRVEVDLSWSDTGVVLGGLTSSDGVVLLESSSSATGARLVVAVPTMDGGSSKARLQLSCSTGPSALVLELFLLADKVEVEVAEESY